MHIVHASGRGPNPAELPAAAVHESLADEVTLYWDAFREAVRDHGVDDRWSPPLLRSMLRVWSFSPFVAQSCISHPAIPRDLIDGGELLIDYRVDHYRRTLRRLLDGVDDTDELAAILRRFRRREMVRIAWRDLAGWSGLGETLRELSLLAEACIDGALEVLHARLRKELGTPLGPDGTAQELVVIGMGKLGARELNFSSDIDLIFAFPEAGETRGRRQRVANEEYFVRLGQRLTNALHATTAEGFVFRTDLRLRPFGNSGPLALSFDALEDYYQEHGREWERYAMIKARPVAGDLAQGYRLLETLKPFVYRRYLDFGAFEALREMKGMIREEVERRELQDNIKIGAGGIREIEFIGQAFQLIRGGREPDLQARPILTVLERLARHGHIPDFFARDLSAAYVFLRRLENRLQACGDEQTHTLPEDPHERQRIALAMGYPDWTAFGRVLDRHRRRVREYFDQVFATPQQGSAGRERTPESGPDWLAVWRGVSEDAAAVAELAAAGYADPVEALRRLRLLRDSHAHRALSAQGRERMARLMPLMIGAVAGTDHPDLALPRALNLVETVARRTVYLSLMAENPMVLSQVVKLCAASPWVAALLSRQPILLDELIDPRTLYAPLKRTELERNLAEALMGIAPNDTEQQLEALHHFKETNVLRVASADVTGAMPLMVVSDYLTEIAEVTLVQVLRLATEHLSRRRGTAGPEAEPGAFAIVAYGKLGGIELGYGSDLDLVFLHDTVESSGRGGPSPDFFARLAQRIIHMLNTHTPSGVLYEVDVRLRPSGASGLLVSNIDAFAEYQREEAWTWEHQALVRARVVAGDPVLRRRFEEIRRAILARRRDPERLRAEVRDMRRRMRTELTASKAGQFDLKQDPGGIADIEFLVQYHVLRWAHEYPDFLEWTDNIRLLETAVRVGIMAPADGNDLADAYRAYRQCVHRLTLQEEGAIVPDDRFRAERAAVSRLWNHLMDR